MSLLEFSETEHQLLKGAAAKYGAAWANAEDVTLTLANVVQIPIVPCDAFLRFYSQAKKYHTLSILSTARQHRVQAKLDLRYCIESVANAAYALAHPDTDNYYDIEKEIMADAKKASGKAYKWLDEKYPAFSKRLKEFKDNVNEETAHAHVLNSAHNFDITPESDIITSFFDFDYELEVEMDLWLAAKVGIEAVGLLLAVQKTYGAIIPHRDTDALPKLMADNDAVHEALLNENTIPEG